MQGIKLVVAVAALATISAAPASAKHLKHHRHAAPAYAAQGGYVVPGGVPYDPGAYHYGPDPYGVYFGSEKVGRDPDPNVRQQMIYDYSYLYSW